MHYYQFNIADYRKDTTHLSRLEHSIYRDLIDWCYLDESPLPLDLAIVSRKLRLCSTDDERALNNVLTDFFERTNEGYTQKRIQQEIEAFHLTIANASKAGKASAEARKNKQLERVLNDRSTNQEPRTNNHKPNKTPLPEASPPVAVEKAETELQAVCRQTWAAYADAYELKYAAKPVRNAKVSSQVKQFVQRIGQDESLSVAEWFVSHPGDYYVKNLHGFGLLLADAEKLRTQWATGRIAQPALQKTQHQINQEATTRAIFGSMLPSARGDSFKTIEGEVVR